MQEQKWNAQIKAARKARKWTQIETSEKVGIANRNYQRIEDGSVWPQEKTLLKICEVLNISIVIEADN